MLRRSYTRIALTAGLFGLAWLAAETLTAPAAEAQQKNPQAAVAVTPWEQFMKDEGVTVHRGFVVQDLTKAKVSPWKRYGIDGALVYLDGSGGVTTGFIFEIQPGKQSTPVRHMWDARVIVLGGEGEARFWNDGGKKVVAKFSKGTMFPLPLNVWYEIVNTGKGPTRMYGVGSAPLIIDIFRDAEFLFKVNHAFKERFSGQPDYFRPEPPEFKVQLRDKLGYAVSVTNLLPDSHTVELYPAGHGALDTAWREKGGSGTQNRHYSMSFDNLDTHIEEFQHSAYEIAHKHGPGANVMYLAGKGYSLVWPPELGKTPYKDGKGDKVVRVDWGAYTVFVPPLQWYHQHFNPSPATARFAKVGAWGSRVHVQTSRVVFQEYADVIDYADEDPQIAKMFVAECAKNGTKSMMPPIDVFLRIKEEEKKAKEKDHTGHSHDKKDDKK